MLKPSASICTEYVPKIGVAFFMWLGFFSSEEEHDERQPSLESKNTKE